MPGMETNEVLTEEQVHTLLAARKVLDDLSLASGDTRLGGTVKIAHDALTSALIVADVYAGSNLARRALR